MTAPRLLRLPTLLAASRAPARAPALLLALAGAATVTARLPVARGAFVGTAVMTAMLSGLWLSRRSATVAVIGLAVATAPVPSTSAAGCFVLAGSLLLVLGVRAVCASTALTVSARSAALRQAGARNDLARQSQAEREQLTSQLRQASIQDPLTGLLHRVAFAARTDAALQMRTPVGVMVLSLCRFRSINDQYGAEVGDELLAALAERLRGAARGSDVVARTGGDEFAVLLTGLGPEAATQVAQRLPRLLDDPFTVGPHVLQLTARAGLALSSDPGTRTAADLLSRSASLAGTARPGDDAARYDPASRSEAAREAELETDLARAIAQDELFLLYQPLVCTRTGRLLSLEALVRWRHPERGIVPPDEFIALSERTGLVVPLGLRVLEMAVATLQALTPHRPGLTMAVNVSARQLTEPDFADQVRRIIWGSGVDPHCIVLELTESLVMEDADAALGVLWALRSLGVRLALDDFGTGYSSLARLGDLPLDELKIDKSFVDRIGAATADSTTLVTAAVAMGHGFGLTVVAEGVEDLHQAAMLTAAGCDLLQGYLLGRPQTVQQLLPQLNQRLLAEPSALPQPRSADAAVLVVPRLMPDLRR